MVTEPPIKTIGGSGYLAWPGEQNVKMSALIDELNAKDREIEVLTQERDNALLRIEDLDNENADQMQVINQQRALIESLAANRGGVNPNA